MPTVASMDTQWGAVVECSVIRHWQSPATTCGASDEQGQVAVTRFRYGCDPPTHPQRGEGSGPRRVGAALFSLVVRVLRRVECQGGFRGA